MVGKRWVRSSRRKVLGVVAVVVVVLAAGGLYWFQPWRLLTNTVVAEQLPVLAAVTSGGPGSSAPAVTMSDHPSNSASPAPSSVASAKPKSTPPSTKLSPSASQSQSSSQSPSPPRPAVAAPAQAVLLAGGQFISHEHQTSGAVQLVRLSDGHRVVVLKDLRTSDGPALHVWLTNAPVLNGSDGWKVFDDGRYLDLGTLKGNIGSQVYQVGDDVELSGYSSVSIWCERFSVSFGAARLDAA